MTRIGRCDMLPVMEPKTLTEGAVISIQALMLEVAGLSGAKGRVSDSPAGARAEGETGAGVCLGGWRGGPGGVPAARAGLTWEEHVTSVWDVPGAHSVAATAGEDEVEGASEGERETGQDDGIRHLFALLDARRLKRKDAVRLRFVMHGASVDAVGQHPIEGVGHYEDRDNAANRQAEDEGKPSHHSPARRLLAALEAAFTN